MTADPDGCIPIAWDLETHPISAGCQAPRMVCLSAYGAEMGEILLAREEGLDWLWQQLRDPQIRLIAHNGKFDWGVACAERPEFLPHVFAEIDAGRIECTRVTELLIRNSRGELKFEWDEAKEEYKQVRFALSDLAQRYLNVRVTGKKGEDAWRLRYNELDGIPINEWPDEAATYAIFDSVYAWRVRQCQVQMVAKNHAYAVGLKSQVQADWALYLMQLWGVRTDRQVVPLVAQKFQALYDKETRVAQQYSHTFPAEIVQRNPTKTRIEALEVKIRKADRANDQTQRAYWQGILEQALAGESIPELQPEKTIQLVDSAGKKSQRLLRYYTREWYESHGQEVALTKTGQVATTRKILAATDSPALQALAERGRWEKYLKTYVPVLEQGTEVPICAYYNAVLESYRTSCSRPNLQNLPGKVPEIRATFIPRNGWLYAFCDYSTLELRALAQICLDLFGYSAMATALRTGRDPHVDMAAQIAGISPEEVLARSDKKRLRAIAKVCNFGFPGGLGVRGFVAYAEALYGLRIQEEESRELKKAYMRAWPEMDDYFRYCRSLLNPVENVADVQFLRSNMHRGKVKYTAVCNGFFQHLAACGAKQACYDLAKECYLDQESVLYGCRPVFFVHDEIGMEIPNRGPELNTRAANRLSEIMICSMSDWIPDIPIKAEPVLLRRWYKDLDPVKKGEWLAPGRPGPEGTTIFDETGDYRPG